MSSVAFAKTPYSRRPRGLMDKASDFESEDWGFESLRGRYLFLVLLINLTQNNPWIKLQYIPEVSLLYYCESNKNKYFIVEKIIL